MERSEFHLARIAETGETSQPKLSVTDGGMQSVQGEGTFVALTHEALDSSKSIEFVKDPEAGAVVLFAGELEAILSGGIISILTGVRQALPVTTSMVKPSHI